MGAAQLLEVERFAGIERPVACVLPVPVGLPVANSQQENGTSMVCLQLAGKLVVENHISLGYNRNTRCV